MYRLERHVYSRNVITNRACLIQTGHHLIKNVTCSRHDIATAWLVFGA
jgi:hypothetical protein